jgi:hypothetical protein
VSNPDVWAAKLVAAARWLPKDHKATMRAEAKSAAMPLAAALNSTVTARVRPAYLARGVKVRAMAGTSPKVKVTMPFLWQADRGAHRGKRTTYTAHRRGSTFKVTRATQMQFRQYARGGYWIEPTLAEAGPDAMAAWITGVAALFVADLEAEAGPG